MECTIREDAKTIERRQKAAIKARRQKQIEEAHGKAAVEAHLGRMISAEEHHAIKEQCSILFR